MSVEKRETILPAIAREGSYVPPKNEIPSGIRDFYEKDLLSVFGHHEEAQSIAVWCFSCPGSPRIYSWPGAELLVGQAMEPHASHRKAVLFSPLSCDQLMEKMRKICTA